MSLKYNMKGILVGRKNCKIDENIKNNVELTGFLDYFEFKKIDEINLYLYQI